MRRRTQALVAEASEAASAGASTQTLQGQVNVFILHKA